MKRRVSVVVLTFGLALGLASLRLIHLGADTPPELSTSVGPYVDEGYKTLSPRNLLLFGTTHWNQEDTYLGWMEASPITQWPYYASFRLFGPNVEAARLVTILYFALLLIGFAWGTSRRYQAGLILGGLALLGLDGTLFFMSRIAIFEVPLAALICCLLFVFARMGQQRSAAPMLLALTASMFLAFALKLSALLYMAPILLAASVPLVRQKWFRRKLVDWRYLTPAAVAVIVLAIVARNPWELILTTVQNRLEFVPADIAHRIVVNPLSGGSPAVVLAGLLCTVHGLLCRPELYLNNIYRLSLVALTLLGIPIVSLFEYDPLRYYIPLLPAYVLSVVEWVHLGGWRFTPRTHILTGAVTVAVMTPWFYFVIGRVGSEVTDHRFFPAVPLILAVLLWALRSRALRGRVVAAALVGMLALFVGQNARSLYSFFFAPTFAAQQIRAELTELLPEDSIIAGVWAPFITLGTSFKSLYIAGVANLWDKLPELAPDYVLHTIDNRNSEPLVRWIKGASGVSIGEAIYSAEYNGETVVLHPLVYLWRSNASLRRGSFAIGRALARADDPEAGEPWLRRSLLERQQEDPVDPLRIAEAQSAWGASLVQLGRHAEAEQPLLAAYDTYRPNGRAPARALARITLKRLVALYERWNRPAELAEYRALLANSE